MKPTGDLFDYTPPPYRGEPPAVRHSTTSKAAASQIKKSIGPLHKRILAHLANGDATDEEMMTVLELSGTQRPRRRELQLMEKVEDSGTTRLTRAGHPSVVWRVAR